MGYDIHIHRAEEWSAADENPIERSEWEAFVDAEADFRMDNFAEAVSPAGETIRIEQDGLAVWLGHPTAEMVWFSWFGGKISVKNPDEAVFVEAAAIAAAFGGRVQGDEGEFYAADGGIEGAGGSDVGGAVPAPEKRGRLFRQRR